MPWLVNDEVSVANSLANKLQASAILSELITFFIFPI